MEERCRRGLLRGWIVRSRVLVAAVALTSVTLPLGAVALSSPTATGAAFAGGQDATAYQMTPNHSGASDDQVGPNWTKS